MNHYLSLIPAAVVVAMLLPAPSAAQRIDSPYRFLEHNQQAGLYAGYANASEGRLGLGPQPGAMFGAHWSMRVSGPFSVEVDVGFLPTNRTVRDTTFDADNAVHTALGEADLSVLTGMVSLRFDVTGARTWNSLQPFLLLGGGVAVGLDGGSDVEQALESDVRFDFGTSFAGQIGAGVDWFPSSRISIRLDGRNALWKLEAPEAFLLTEQSSAVPRSEWEQNFVVTAGLSIHF